MHGIWKDMFILGVPLLEKILRPIIVYVFLIAGLRLSGKRELAQLNPFDLVVLLTLSNTVQNAIIGEDNSVTGGIIGAISLLAINYLVVRFLYDHRKIDQIVEGSGMHEGMAEGVELPEVHKIHEEYRYTLAVSLTMSILAVLVAVATLLGHRAHTEELLVQSKAVDQWAYYQAKNNRMREMQGFADLLGALAPSERKETAALRDKYLNEVERYQSDKEDISEKAKEFEKERDVMRRRP